MQKFESKGQSNTTPLELNPNQTYEDNLQSLLGFSGHMTSNASHDHSADITNDGPVIVDDDFLPPISRGRRYSMKISSHTEPSL